MRLTVEVEPCETIEQAAQFAQWVADRAETTVVFEFNGIDCFAVPGGSSDRLAELQQETQTVKPCVFSDA